MLQWVLNKLLNGEYFTWAGKSTWDVVSALTEDKRLRAILCGQWGDYGLKPQDSSFMIQARQKVGLSQGLRVCSVCADTLDVATPVLCSIRPVSLPTTWEGPTIPSVARALSRPL